MNVYMLCTVADYEEEDHGEALDRIRNGSTVCMTLAGAKQVCQEEESEMIADCNIGCEQDELTADTRLVWEEGEDGTWSAGSGSMDQTYLIRKIKVLS